MDTPVIIDGIAAAALLAFVIWGACRGLFRSVAGLAVVIAALVGAGVFANMAAPVAARYLQPVIEKRVEERVDQALGGSVVPREPQVGGAEETEDPEALDMAALLGLLGIDADPAGPILEKAREQARETGADLAAAVVQGVAESILHAVLFTLGFLVLLVVLKLLVGAMDLVLKLPGLHMANALGGAAVGLIEGALALFLAVWVLRRLGVSFDTELVEQTRLLRFFAENTPLSALSFL